MSCLLSCSVGIGMGPPLRLGTIEISFFKKVTNRNQTDTTMNGNHRNQIQKIFLLPKNAYQ